jgi:hypothetical protein
MDWEGAGRVLLAAAQVKRFNTDATNAGALVQFGRHPCEQSLRNFHFDAPARPLVSGVGAELALIGLRA